MANEKLVESTAGSPRVVKELVEAGDNFTGSREGGEVHGSRREWDTFYAGEFEGFLA